MGTFKEVYRNTIHTCRRLFSALARFAEKSWPCANAVRLSPRCSKGLFRGRVDALGRQGSIIIIVVVVRFDCDTAACLWKGAL